MKKAAVTTVISIVLPILAALAQVVTVIMDNHRIERMEAIRDEIDTMIK